MSKSKNPPQNAVGTTNGVLRNTEGTLKGKYGTVGGTPSKTPKGAKKQSPQRDLLSIQNVDEENSANWIIGRICGYADAVSEPFSYYELLLLRQSLEFFNETNRADFLALNKKTVQMIRETIEDEKLDRAECVEARSGLTNSFHSVINTSASQSTTAS